MRLVPKSRGLLRDQRGATMVMGVFIAVLLVGMIYYVWGIGDAILHRERMQDASDTAAFSAAVIHARGMNMLAMINLIMGVLSMVGATMAIITEMIAWGAGIASAVCLGCGPWCASCCDACPYAARHWAEYADARGDADDVNDTIDDLMDGLDTYAQAIERGVPLAAQAKVASYGADVYAPVTNAGVMLPLRTQLPVEEDDSDWPADEKVLPVAAPAAAVGVWLWASTSWYMLGGVGVVGLLRSESITEDWVEDHAKFRRIAEDAREMGNDEYQLQAYMLGDPDLEWTQTGVAVATWGEDDDTSATYSRLADLSRVSFAQAEFFYDDDESDWREWLWHLNWRARLRRWRHGGVDLGPVTEACGSAPGCAELRSISELEGAVVH